MPSLIRTIKAIKFLEKGCSSFVTYMKDGNKGEKKLEDIKVNQAFLVVFLDGIPSLPPERQVGFPSISFHG